MTHKNKVKKQTGLRKCTVIIVFDGDHIVYGKGFFEAHTVGSSMAQFNANFVKPLPRNNKNPLR